jgi:hypothetical protein
MGTSHPSVAGQQHIASIAHDAADWVVDFFYTDLTGEITRRVCTPHGIEDQRVVSTIVFARELREEHGETVESFVSEWGMALLDGGTKRAELFSRRLLTDLCDQIDEAGGLTDGDDHESLVPVGLPGAVELAGIYLKACQFLEREPRLERVRETDVASVEATVFGGPECDAIA